MATTEKFCLKWNDFQKNISSSFKEIREDFCDVTLAGEGNQKILAHKVILAASSSFFRDILKENQHPHPLLYMKGIKGVHLASIVDFMYHGEVDIVQEDLNDFLVVADELQLKGLIGKEPEPNDIKQETHQSLPQKLRNNRARSESLNQFNYDTQKSETIQEYHTKIEENTDGTIVPVDSSASRINTTYEDLNDQIQTMLSSSEGQWSCTQCGKADKRKSLIVYHIEAKHIEGVSHPCNQCGRQFRSRHSLSQHTSSQHKVSN